MYKKMKTKKKKRALYTPEIFLVNNPTLKTKSIHKVIVIFIHMILSKWYNYRKEFCPQWSEILNKL